MVNDGHIVGLYISILNQNESTISEKLQTLTAVLIILNASCIQTYFCRHTAFFALTKLCQSKNIYYRMYTIQTLYRLANIM